MFLYHFQKTDTFPDEIAEIIHVTFLAAEENVKLLFFRRSTSGFDT